MRRTKSYDELVAENLRSPKQVQAYLLALMEGDDGLKAEEALKLTISRMGVKEFAEMVKAEPNNISAFLRGRRKLKPETLEGYLKKFKLKVRIVFEKAS